MDRVIVYQGALPQTIDELNTNKFMLVGQAYQNMAMLGTSTVVAGLACTPTSPTPDLHVTVGVGSIYQLDPTDASAYGDLGVDNNVVMKQGINVSPDVLSITPPGTPGFSQVYLVQAILNDVDGGSTVLSYFNSADETHPYSGPANSGISQFTTRTCQCVIALKAGLAATTGTQVTPTPDAGYVGLYAVTVANGATQITSGNIVQVATAPFFPALPQVPYDVLNGQYVYAGVDTGGANAYVITFLAGQPQPTAYKAGMGVKFKALTTNTGASTINVNGLGLVTLHRATGAGLAANDITSGQIVELTYDGTFFQMQNYLGSGTNTNTNTQVGIPYIADSGAQNALVGTYSPAITSGQQVAGLTLAIKLANDITGQCTINVNGLGVKSVTLGDATDPPFRAFLTGEILILEYDGTRYQIVNTSAGMFYRRPIANTTIFVNGSTGSDTLRDGTSATVGSGTSGPVATIGKAVQIAYGYAPSQFTITISIAAGTYNEAVASPSYAGPQLIIDGGSAAGTIISSGANTCFNVSGSNVWSIRNVTVQNNGANSNFHGFAAGSGAIVTTTNTISNLIGGTVFNGVLTPGTHTFSGSCAAMFAALFGGFVGLPQVVYTINTPISVAVATAYCLSGDILLTPASPPIFVNPSFVNGPKYQVVLNGVISAVTLGVNFFPGNSAGITATGGQYAS